MAGDIKFEITEHIGILSKGAGGGALIRTRGITVHYKEVS